MARGVERLLPPNGTVSAPIPKLRLMLPPDSQDVLAHAPDGGLAGAAGHGTLH